MLCARHDFKTVAVDIDTQRGVLGVVRDGLPSDGQAATLRHAELAWTADRNSRAVKRVPRWVFPEVVGLSICSRPMRDKSSKRRPSPLSGGAEGAATRHRALSQSDCPMRRAQSTSASRSRPSWGGGGSLRPHGNRGCLLFCLIEKPKTDMNVEKLAHGAQLPPKNGLDASHSGGPSPPETTTIVQSDVRGGSSRPRRRLKTRA